jgi:hypothetical protein
MNKFKKMAIALAAVTIMAGPSMGAQILCGGNVPLVNTMVGIAELSLDFSGAGSGVQIAAFIINNNSQTFTVTWKFSNSGSFVNATSGNSIPFISPVTFEDGGIAPGWGTASPLTTDPSGDQLALVQVAATGVVIHSGTQTAATINKKVLIKASWADASAKLAGLYTEQIKYSIVVTL